MSIELWQGFLKGQPHRLLVEDRDETTTIILEPVREGFLTDLLKDTVSFAKNHPFLTGMLAQHAYDSVKKYIQAKSSALNLYAKDVSERPKYQEMIKDLEKNGWKVVKSRYVPGSTQYHWELHRK